jgi:hypothetical protein
MIMEITLDLIVGADEIAQFLGIKRRQVYAMREAGNPLIRCEQGLGLVASRRALMAHFGMLDVADVQKSA